MFDVALAALHDGAAHAATVSVTGPGGLLGDFNGDGNPDLGIAAVRGVLAAIGRRDAGEHEPQLGVGALVAQAKDAADLGGLRALFGQGGAGGASV